MYEFFDRVVPNTARGWLALGTFLLMVYILTLVAFVKELDSSQLFTALASGIVGSGFGSIIGYHFATTAGSSETRQLAQSAMDLVKNAPVVVDPPATATVKVEEDVRTE